MKYQQVKLLKDVEFRRLTGVRRETFALMLKVLRTAARKRRKIGGPPPDVSLENRLLMTLEYLREYRTYFHIGQSYEQSHIQQQGGLRKRNRTTQKIQNYRR